MSIVPAKNNNINNIKENLNMDRTINLNDHHLSDDLDEDDSIYSISSEPSNDKISDYDDKDDETTRFITIVLTDDDDDELDDNDNNGIVTQDENKHMNSDQNPTISPDFLNNECSICLDPLGIDDYSILDKCFHKYHEKCIRDWVKITGNHICPDCNTINEARLTIHNDNKAKLPELTMIKIETVKNTPSNPHKKISIQDNENNEDNHNNKDIRNIRCNCIIC